MVEPVGPYKPAVRVGDVLYCSGQVGLRDGKLVEGFEAQAEQALKNVADLLSSNGSAMSRVVKTTVFLTDMADYARMNEIYLAAFGDHRPARSAVAVAGLPLGAEIEIEVIASGS